MQIPEDAIRYIDRLDVSETFVDSLGLVTFDGQVARIELCVTRVDPPNPPKKITARKYPACRLAMTPDGFIGLYNALDNLIKGLEAQGLVKRGELGKPGPGIKAPFIQ